MKYLMLLETMFSNGFVAKLVMIHYYVNPYFLKINFNDDTMRSNDGGSKCGKVNNGTGVTGEIDKHM